MKVLGLKEVLYIPLRNKQAKGHWRERGRREGIVEEKERRED
jgi:hypothetical protein